MFSQARLNAKSDGFVSWHREPGATAVDAFSITWADFNCYAFPQSQSAVSSFGQRRRLAKRILSRLRHLCTFLSSLTCKKGTDVRKTPSTHCAAFLTSVDSDLNDGMKTKQRCRLLRQRNEVKCPFNLVEFMGRVFPSKEPFSNNEYQILGANLSRCRFCCSWQTNQDNFSNGL